jgi:hypothetical protein
MVPSQRKEAPVKLWLLWRIFRMLISWNRKNTLSCRFSKNLLVMIVSIFSFIYIYTHFLDWTIKLFWQPRNARKACPNGVPVPEWILKSREIGSFFIPVKFVQIFKDNLKFQFKMFWSLRFEMLVWNMWFRFVFTISLPMSSFL